MYPQNYPRRNLEWKLLTQCNYNCWYCLDKGDRVSQAPNAECIDKYVQPVIASLKEPWVIQITGGEPFLNPSFIIGLAKKLINEGHWIKIFSNLSADIEAYVNFVKITGGKLYKFKASFHMDEAVFDEFLLKAIEIKKQMHYDSKFKIFCVIPPNVEKIIQLKKYFDLFKSNGLECDVIHMIDPRTKSYYQYTEAEKKLIRDMFGICTNEIELEASEGVCRSGCSYFIVTPELEAWSCWDAKFNNDRSRYYGNFKEGTFKFPYKGGKCPYDKCNYPNGVEDFKTE